ncbi:MAG: SBBP repeat-containing protein [Nitrospirae bacterium]|nr:SBBP repeat-containing protein [Nitrospirota bacterium]
MAVDSSGNAYVTGYTGSTNFPTTAGAYDTASNGYYDAFVTKLNAAGTALVYSTYLGGSNYDYGYGIAVDSSGNAYVTGYTYSTDFPTTAGAYDTASNGGYDAFLAKIGDVSGQYALSVTKAGAGSGTITSSPAGIDCGNDCYENYAANTVVTLTATPASGSTFTGWNSDADCSDGVVTMDANKNCTATFFKPTLTVTKVGIGTVTSIPAGINCGTDCSEAYNPGTSVTLTATPSTNYSFAGWSGDDCSDGVVTMNAIKTCTAIFNTTSGGGDTGSSSGGDGGGSGGCGVISDNKKGNQPPASGMAILLLPLLYLIYRRVRRVLWSNLRM